MICLEKWLEQLIEFKTILKKSYATNLENYIKCSFTIFPNFSITSERKVIRKLSPLVGHCVPFDVMTKQKDFIKSNFRRQLLKSSKPSS